MERTFGWMMRWRWLVRDYDQCLDAFELVIKVTSSTLMLRRTAYP